MKILLAVFLFLLACSSPQKASPDAVLKAQKAYDAGIKQANSGNAVAAEAYFREAISLDPDFLGGYLGLGGLFAQSGKIDEALNVYRNALDQLGDRPEIYEDLAFAYDNAGDKENAIRSLERALLLRSKFPDTPENRKWIEQDKKGIEALKK